MAKPKNFTPGGKALQIAANIKLGDETQPIREERSAKWRNIWNRDTLENSMLSKSILNSVLNICKLQAAI